MGAHSSSSPSRFERFRRAWKRLFFWQTASTPNVERVTPNTHDRALVAAVSRPSRLPRWRQFRYLSHVFSKRERVQFWSALTFGAIFLVFSGALFLEPHIVRQPAVGGILSEGVIGTPKWINPVLAPITSDTADRDITSLVFSSLFRWDGLLLKPDLAVSSQLLNDGKTFEVRLREDARFHDGQPVTTDDVEFTVTQAIKNPLWRSPLGASFTDVQTIRVDPQTIQFTHAQQTLSLAQWQELLTFGILPGHRWQEATDGGSPQLAEENLRPVGSGPYAFGSFTRDNKGAILAYSLKRFDGYYGDKPYIQERIFRVYPDRQIAEQALQSNQIDALAFVPWSERSDLRLTESSVTKIELPQVTTVFFNTQDALLKDLTVRKALQQTIDRGRLIELLGHGTAVQSPFPFFETYSTSTHLQNIDAARALLEASRWKINPETGTRFLQPAPVSIRTTRGTTNTSESTSFSTSTPLTISLLTPDQGDLGIVADYLKQQWSLLGAQVTVEPLDRQELLRRALEEKSHQAILWNVLTANDERLLPFWTTGDQSLNLAQWNNAALQQALGAVIQASNTDDLARTRTAVAEHFSSNVPAIFLLRPSHAYILPSSVKGVRELQIRQRQDRLMSTLSWHLKTRFRWKSLP